VALRPRPELFSASVRRLSSLPPDLRLRVRHLLFAGPWVMGWPDLTRAADWIASVPWKLPVPEFSRQSGLETLARRFPDRVVRAHSLDEDEIARLTPDAVTARFRRAVRDRGARFLYLRLFPGLGPEENTAYIRRLAWILRDDGFSPAPARARYAPGRFMGLRQAGAWLAACFLPVLALKWVLSRRPPAGAGAFGGAAASVAALTVLALASALAAAALLSEPAFALGLARFRGVKAALVIPLVLAFFHLYSAAEIRRFLSKPLTMGAAVFALAAAGAAAVYVLRSGHGTALDAGGLERTLRANLESLLSVRPRFKEFAFGYPLLWLGFYLRWRAGAAAKGRPALADGRAFILMGFVGPLSMVNTFCHAHAPLSVSLLRTFHGVWLGALGGAALAAAARFLMRR
ncbi:MAG: DUF5693 family protein, partial [Elusimicrobiota bacterium]